MAQDDTERKDVGAGAAERSAPPSQSGDPCRRCSLLAALDLAAGLRERAMDHFPPEFVEHAFGARREFLLAVKSLVDEGLRVHEEQLRVYEERRAERAMRKPQKVALE